MELLYERSAVQELAEDLGAVRRICSRIWDEQFHAYEVCRGRYSRLHTEIEQRLRSARNALEAAESESQAAAAEQAAAARAAQAAEREAERSAALARAQRAQSDRAAAELAREEAAAELKKAGACMEQLTSAWETYSLSADVALRQAEERMGECARLTAGGQQDLEAFITIMEQARADLYGRSGAAAESGGAGWCGKNSMRAVGFRPDGSKCLTMRIGGEDRTYPCSKAGAETVYRDAARTGDGDLMARASAIFEIETLREDLELTAGDAGTVQLGGYHRDVKEQDPPGYVSHHIPARAVQDQDAEWLPCVSLTAEDHKQTSSYAGKQRHVCRSFLPSRTPARTYQQETSRKIGAGSSGYVEVVRNELYDLRVCTGHKYDGGVSAYLDTVVDMIASRGIPGASPEAE